MLAAIYSIAVIPFVGASGKYILLSFSVSVTGGYSL